WLGQRTLITRLRRGEQVQGVDSLIADDGLAELAATLEHVDEVVDHTSLEPHHHIQVAQTHIGVDDTHSFAQACQGGSYVGRRRSLADPALAGRDHYGFGVHPEAPPPSTTHLAAERYVSQPMTVRSAGNYTIVVRCLRGGFEAFDRAPAGDSGTRVGPAGGSYRKRASALGASFGARLRPLEAGVLQQEALGAGSLEDDRDLGARPFTAEPDHRALPELGMLDALTPAVTGAGGRRSGRGRLAAGRTDL